MGGGIGVQAVAQRREDGHDAAEACVAIVSVLSTGVTQVGGVACEPLLAGGGEAEKFSEGEC